MCTRLELQCRPLAHCQWSYIGRILALINLIIPHFPTPPACTAFIFFLPAASSGVKLSQAPGHSIHRSSFLLALSNHFSAYFWLHYLPPVWLESVMHALWTDAYYYEWRIVFKDYGFKVIRMIQRRMLKQWLQRR